MNAPRRLTWPALRSEIATGILGLSFIPIALALFPLLGGEIDAEMRNASVARIGLVEEAEIVEKDIDFGQRTITYEWSTGRARIVLKKHEYDLVAPGNRMQVYVDPGDPTYAVTPFDRRSEGRLPSAFGFVPLIGLLLLGIFLVVRAVRRHRFLVHGVAADFELVGARKLLGFPVRYRANGRTFQKVIDLPVTLSPVPEEPASDAMLLLDPDHPERCIAARRGMFRQTGGWQATAARIASVLSASDVELPREVRADLEIVPADDEEAKAWVSVIDRHLGANRALEGWMIQNLAELSPEKRRAVSKLTSVRRIDRRRTRRIKSAMSFGTAWVAYLAAIGGTGEALWMLPVLAVGPIAYAVISLVGVED